MRQQRLKGDEIQKLDRKEGDVANPQPAVNWGARSGKPSPRDWQSALRRAIAQHATPDVMRKIADVVIEKALAGDMEAIKEIGNRLDGKAVQATELTVNSNAMFSGMSVDEIRASIRERLRQDVGVAAALGLKPELPAIEGESVVVAPVDAVQR